MRQVRFGVFETNSSSTHSLTFCTQEEFDKWVSGKILFDKWNEQFIKNRSLTDEEQDASKEYYNQSKTIYWKDWEQLSDEEIQSWNMKYLKRHDDDNSIQSYLDWCNDNYSLESFVEHYTSPSGDKIVAFGKYGNDY